MKKKYKTGLIVAASLMGGGCTMLPIQHTLKATDLSKGSIEIAVNGGTRTTQSQLTDIDHVLFTLQSVNAPAATSSLTFAQLSQGGASGSVIFPDLWPGIATVSATIYGSNEIRTQALLEEIGAATATASVVGGQVTSVPMNIKLDDTQTQLGGLAINLGLQGGNDTFTRMPYKVTTIAGSDTSGTSDGRVEVATFSRPMAIALDATGSIYVIDLDDSRIRKISPDGWVSPIPGGSPFSSSYGLAVDLHGNVYVAESYSDRIRKITPDGVVTTLGVGTTFNKPYGVAVDADENVYVSDGNNHLIRKITPGGVVSTLPGAGAFTFPVGITVDATGNIYVVDGSAHLIKKITPGGVVSTLAGSTTPGTSDGQGTAAQFYYPSHIAVDAAGNLYVADNYNNTIRKITPGGFVRTIAGNGEQGMADGTGTAAQLNMPYGIAADAAGNVYVGDTLNHRIRKISY